MSSIAIVIHYGIIEQLTNTLNLLCQTLYHLVNYAHFINVVKSLTSNYAVYVAQLCRN